MDPAQPTGAADLLDTDSLKQTRRERYRAVIMMHDDIRMLSDLHCISGVKAGNTCHAALELVEEGAVASESLMRWGFEEARGPRQ